MAFDKFRDDTPINLLCMDAGISDDAMFCYRNRKQLCSKTASYECMKNIYDSSERACGLYKRRREANGGEEVEVINELS